LRFCGCIVSLHRVDIRRRTPVIGGRALSEPVKIMAANFFQL
jgi:hypothetical protein